VWILIIGLLLFLLPHTLSELGQRDRLMASLPSIGAYKGLYTLVVLTGLALIIFGKSQSPFVMMWQPIYELRFLSMVLMIPAVILVLAGNLPPNYLRKYLRNPMLLGVTLWGIAHLWANGDLASILLFGSFTLWAGGKFIVKSFSGARSTATSLNSSDSAQAASLIWDGIAIAAGLAVYVLISIYHGQLFGVGLSFE